LGVKTLNAEGAVRPGAGSSHLGLRAPQRAGPVSAGPSAPG